MSSINEVKEQLARRLAASAPSDAAYLRKETVTVAVVPTPFFRHGGIVETVDRARRKPWRVYIAWAGSDFAVSLSGLLDQFMSLAAKAKVDLSTNELRIAYVQTMLEVTANASSRHILVSNSDQIPVRPGCTTEEASRMAAVRERYRGSAMQPTVTPLQGAAQVSVHALIEQDLVRIDVVLHPNGSVSVSRVLLEKDLAMPYAI